MIRRVRARAYANIALIKYWGKLDELRNLPATSSVSLALDSLVTETVVTKTREKRDRIELNGKSADRVAAQRIRDYLDIWRARGLLTGPVRKSSTNEFPTAAGLASSSSGFAALATALGKLSETSISESTLSRLARLGSGSAARSIVGGVAAMPTGNDPAARLLIAPDRAEFGMVVAIAGKSEKEISSREAMKLCKTNSPYFKAWLDQSRRDYKAMLAALRKFDIEVVGEIAEANALAMHACMIATRPSIVYWNETTLRLIELARAIRSDGIAAYATIDAGPNVCFLCGLSDLDRVLKRVSNAPGIDSAFIGKPAGGSKVLEWE